MEKNFNPQTAEPIIYQNWLTNKYFHPDATSSKPKYAIAMPPPNITGALHIGHALNNTIQDVLIRFKRMQGYETLWMPGTDHASIATEQKIVSALKVQGISKEDIGREKFLEHAWQWKEEYGGIIVNQLKRLGVSCDWDRERFTLDEGLSDAVLEVFVDYYKKGYIYRGEKLINWCPVCQTTISDAEVEHKENPGHIWHMSYRLPDGTPLTFATTRPETILGDVAVAVNPEDERYAHLVGQTVTVPIVNREIPIIADKHVDKEFGTGVVKVTPAHDFNDNEMGQRHGLPSINVFNDDATINENGASFQGLDRYAAREKIIQTFTELGQFVKAEPHQNNVGHHDRCGVVVEPLNKLQWFVKMEDLAKPALEALHNKELNFVPERFSKIYSHWLENIKDWCISRQLWWGHRIPVYYCACGELTVSKNTPSGCASCGSTQLTQDEDVLDTWFSSALWPFSTLGWPAQTPDLAKFYPTDVLVTGPDIIFSWVVRMVFSGLEFTGQVPFKDVIINGIVRDEQGRKLSKNLGNGIDPLEIIDQYGTDALRTTLIMGSAMGADQRFYMEKVEASRNFLNKIWNGARFIDFNQDDITQPSNAHLSLADKWIMNKLNNLVAEITTNMENYDMGVAIQKVYDFAWDEYCDWYVEMSKAYLKDEATKAGTLYTLRYIMLDILRLLHPYAPFITEEIFTSLQKEEPTILFSAYPTKDEALDYSKEEAIIEETKNVIKAIRQIRQERNVAPSKKVKIIIVAEGAAESYHQPFLQTMANASEVRVQTTLEGISEDATSAVLAGGTLYIEDLLDVAKEIERLTKEQKHLTGEIKRAKGMLANEKFMSKAPEAMVNAEKEKLAGFEVLLEKVEAMLSKYQG